MKLLPVFVALMAVSQPQCQNPFAPTPATVAGPRSPTEYCAQFTGGFGPAYYCYTPQGNVWDAAMPHNWGGYCMLPERGGLGVTGYSAITFSGRMFPVTDHARANAYCNSLVSTGSSERCSSVIQCRR